MWYKNVGTTFFRFVTKITHLTDRRTDRQLSRG